MKPCSLGWSKSLEILQEREDSGKMWALSPILKGFPRAIGAAGVGGTRAESQVGASVGRGTGPLGRYELPALVYASRS